MATVLSFVDFKDVPFSVPHSRFVLVREDDSYTVYWIRYEVPLTNAVVVHDLNVFDHGGNEVAPLHVSGGHVEFADGSVLAIFEDTLSLQVAPRSHIRWREDLKLEETPIAALETPHRLVLSGSAPRSHEQIVTLADQLVTQWMAKAPQAADSRRQPMVNQCWWVLGINTLVLNGADRMKVVVPSKRGYVGHWQWDAYFIAVGLRHGDIDLATEQMDVALKYQSEQGQLPDVVHEDGILASSQDLPESDRRKLRETGYDTEAAPIALTKPPLTAWAAGKVLEKVTQQDRSVLAGRWYPKIQRAADWWFNYSDVDGDGVPEYSHPYSSGLDDSPVFDYGAPVETPDLTAYLCLQDHLLAQQATGKTAQTYADRSALLRDRLVERWDPKATMFVSVHNDKKLCDRTIVSLLGVVAPGLPDQIVDEIINEIESEARFGAPYGIPTVSQDDPKFDPIDMWRGPIWINTAYLVADGLERNGRLREARRIRTAILDLVEHAQGPSEYYHPDTGQASPTAVRCFAWSAALYIDLAVTGV